MAAVYYNHPFKEKKRIFPIFSRDRRLFILLFFLLQGIGFQSSGQASLDTIKVIIDTITRQPNIQAPFDQSFYILLPTDTSLTKDNLLQLEFYQIINKKGKNYYTTLFRYDKTTLQNLSVFKPNPLKLSYKYLQIHVITQLEPGIKFGINLYHQITNTDVDALEKINTEILASNDSAEVDYRSLALSETFRFSDDDTIKWAPFRGDDQDTENIYNGYALQRGDYYLKYFQNSIKNDYGPILSVDSTIQLSLDTLRDIFKGAKFSSDSFFNCNCQKKFIANELFVDSSIFLIPFFNIYHLDSAAGLFAEGQMNIQEYEQFKAIEKTDVATRLNNLGKLQQALKSISYFFQMSSYSKNVPYETKKSIYNVILSALAKIDAKQKALAAAELTIRKKIQSYVYFFGGDRSYGVAAPVGQDMKTSAGNHIIADFGLANFGTSVNNQFGYSIRPYVGVNISLRPINKNIKLRDIQNKTILTHLSLVFGLTTSGLTRQGTYDLFKSMSAISGVGIRLSRPLRIVTGIIWYDRDNPNPLLAPQLAIGPMVSLSLDLDTISLFGKLTDLIF